MKEYTNSNTPVVSVCMITFNHEMYIREAIEGVIMQKTNFNFELVIGEDHSTDITLKICKEYESKYPGIIRILSSDRNLGMIPNFVRTIKACMGNYIAICEGDDYWTDPNKIKKQVDFLELNPDYGMVHTDVNHYYENKKRLEPDFNKTHGIDFPSGNIFDEYLKGDLFIKTASVVVRRDIFVKAFDFNLFKERKWMLGDLPTWLSIAACSKIKYFEETTATYRLLAESASRTKNSEKLLQFHKHVFEIRYYYWEEYSGKPEIKRELDYYSSNTLMGDAYKLKSLSNAKEALNKYKSCNIAVPFKARMKFFIIVFATMFKKTAK